MKNSVFVLIIIAISIFKADAQGYFMKIENPIINGEVKTPTDHENDIQVIDFKYEIENDAKHGFTGIGFKSRSSLITVFIPQGKAANKICQAVNLGTLFGKVIIAVQYNTSTGFKDYVKYEFEQVKFGSCNTAVMEGEENIVTVAFKSGRYKVKHNPVKPDQTLDSELQFGRDFILNTNY